MKLPRKKPRAACVVRAGWMWERRRVESLVRREECSASWKVAGAAGFEVGGEEFVVEVGGVYIGGAVSTPLAG